MALRNGCVVTAYAGVPASANPMTANRTATSPEIRIRTVT
jgi:hypothetical protein